MPSFVTKVNGQFVNGLRSTCITLACKYNISIRKVSVIIQQVLKMVGVDVSLQGQPSKTTIERLFMEANVIAKSHCNVKLKEDFNITDGKGNVIHVPVEAQNLE